MAFWHFIWVLYFHKDLVIVLEAIGHITRRKYT